MNDTIRSGEVLAMLRGAATTIRAHHQQLTDLDSATGDGDHGTAMVRAVEALEATLESSPDTGLEPLLEQAGWAVMAAAGGSAGPLFGAFLIGMGQGAGEHATADQLDAPAVAALIRCAVANVQQHTTAQVGDRTMMDALLPAVAALDEHAASVPPAELLRRAAAAAAAGADATRGMQAKFGRARNLGARVIGHADPGATSMSLVLAGFASALESPPLP